MKNVVQKFGFYDKLKYNNTRNNFNTNIEAVGDTKQTGDLVRYRSYS